MKKSPENILIEWLVINSQRGDRKAVDLLVKRWHPKLLRQALRLTHDKEAALDITQESWQGIIRGLKNLKDPAVFPTWSYQIVSRRAADWIRGLQKQRKINDNVRNEHLEEGQEEESENKISALKKALKQLPDEQQVILDLFYLEQQSVRDIAQAMNLPSGTVKSRLFYAREHLKGIIKNMEI